VSGANPHTLTVISSTVTALSFPVSCQPNPTLRVTATTTGPNAPPSYQVGIDPDYYGYAHSLTVASNGNASIKLPPGSHRVNLIVPLNCTVTSPNNVLVSVPLGTTTDLAFAVTCH
jgi:hypothetical protein